MLYLLGVIAFALGLLGSIALHEVGHMVPAKKFGVKVTQYMVGFGPTLWSRRRGETEYGVKAIPLGGYIRMIGMIPPREDGKRSRWPRRLADLAEDFRNSSRADVEPGDEPREFYRLPPWKKIIVMVGGPSMNLVIYLVLTVLLLGILGTKQATEKVAAVVTCVAPAGTNQPTVQAGQPCPTGTQTAPANGVLQAGDRILAVNGVRTDKWADSVKIIEGSAGKALTITVDRNGTTQNLTLTPVANTKYVSDDPNDKTTKTVGFVGIEMGEKYVAVPLTQIPGQVADQIGQGFQALGSFPSKIGNLFATVFENKPRDPQGAVGVVGLGRIGGQVASSNIDVLDKVYFLLFLLAGVNLLLFLFNLLPLLPLDGGHVAGAIVESAKNHLARRRRNAVTAGESGLAPPAKRIYVDTAQMVPVLYCVASLLLAFSLLVIYADIVHPITLGG